MPSVIAASDLPDWLVRVTAFLFGATWGSFFNVAIYRWPRELSVVRPASHCPACGAPVPWYLNIPLVSYLLLRGRTRCCAKPLNSRYLWVELISGVLCVALFERIFVHGADGRPAWQAAAEGLCYFAFVGGLIVATFVDLEWIEIPDEVTLPGTALGLATVTFREAPGPAEAALGAGLGFLIVQLLFVWLYELGTGRRGMGEGDSKLLMMIGAFLGWQAVLFCLIAGSVQGLIAAVILRLSGQPLSPSLPPELTGGDPSEEPAAPAGAPEDDPYADLPDAPMMVFGPLLSLAAIEYFFFGESLVNLYVSLLSGGS